MGYKLLNDWWQSFISVFYPNLCWGCEAVIYASGEGLCPDCILSLPYTNFHDDKQNPVSKTFWGRLPLEGATALFYFDTKTRVQRLIHQLKYKSKPQIGEVLGSILGSQLAASHTFSSVDVVIPVTLHEAKRRKRGYNQAYHIALGVASSLGVEALEHGLIRTKNTSTQTKKSREERVKNMRKVFQIANPEHLEGKHILLVDDVVTTGSTLESCALQLLTVKQVKMSIATLAFAE